LCAACYQRLALSYTVDRFFIVGCFDVARRFAFRRVELFFLHSLEWWKVIRRFTFHIVDLFLFHTFLEAARRCSRWIVCLCFLGCLLCLLGCMVRYGTLSLLFFLVRRSFVVFANYWVSVCREDVWESSGRSGAAGSSQRWSPRGSGCRIGTTDRFATQKSPVPKQHSEDLLV
jgi:hypothetical protein